MTHCDCIVPHSVAYTNHSCTHTHTQIEAGDMLNGDWEGDACLRAMVAALRGLQKMQVNGQQGAWPSTAQAV